jgi:TonB family protein
MTARRDPILTFALCASLVAHTAILLILAGQFVDSLPALPLAGIRGAGAKAAPPVVMVMRSPPPPPTPPSYLLFGDSHGTGEAANASPGEKPMMGRDGPQVQAFLSRDPVGAGDVGHDPSMSVLPRGAPAQPSAQASAQQELPASPPTLKAIGVADSVQAWSKPHVARAAPAPAAAQAPAAVPAPVGAELPPADPAIMSDSESDAFAKGNAIEFKDGRVDVRFGRKVKTVRPRLSLAATYDLMAMEGPRMVVRVSVDPTGNVRLVNIVKSTGSESADQAVKVALYQWWFEPPKDKSGKALADVVEFPIVWR